MPVHRRGSCRCGLPTSLMQRGSWPVSGRDQHDSSQADLSIWGLRWLLELRLLWLGRALSPAARQMADCALHSMPMSALASSWATMLAGCRPQPWHHNGLARWLRALAGLICQSRVRAGWPATSGSRAGLP